MKRTMSVLAVFLIAMPLIAAAATFRASDQVSLGSSEHVAGNVYMAGGAVNSAGVTTGDLLAAGGTVVITGAVGADLAAAGGTVTVLGPIAGDARVTGGTLVLESAVMGDVVALGGQVTIGGPGVKGDAMIAGGSIRIDAPLSKSLTVRGGNVYINAPITGSIDIDAESVTLGSGAVISGDFTYTASKEVTKEEGAVVRGQIHFEPKPALVPKEAMSASALLALSAAWILGKFLILLVCALVAGLMLRRYSMEVVTRAVRRPLAEFGRGVITVVALPILSILLLVTIILMPFGALGLIGYSALLIITWIMTPILVGSWLYGYFSKKPHDVSWQTILLGVVVYSAVGVLPIIGWLLCTLACLITLGAITAIKLDAVQEWK